ncbi:hypothetical protein E4U21_003879 [Claviceps maximensis]|nr:hypothetical protein E4U21_003879 [Claviceps maximensis]
MHPPSAPVSALSICARLPARRFLAFVEASSIISLFGRNINHFLGQSFDAVVAIYSPFDQRRVAYLAGGAQAQQAVTDVNALERMDKFTQRWVQHLRNTSRQTTPPRNARCPLCDAGFEPNVNAFKAHVRSSSMKHPTLTEDSEIEETFKNIVLQQHDVNEAASSNIKPLPDTESDRKTTGKRPVAGSAEEGDTAGGELDRLKLGSDGTQSSRQRSKRLCSPTTSITHQKGSPPQSPSSRGKARQRNSINEFDRGIQQRNQTARRLWVPDDRGGVLQPDGGRTAQTRHRHGHFASFSINQPRSSRQKQPNLLPHHLISHEPSWSPMRMQMPQQPSTHSITSDQLLSEVKGIYAGLVLLEAKCVEYDTSLVTVPLNNHQYNALISLHQSLLHEHHDFYLASQHPSAGDVVQEVAARYAMPARMWRHGIHSFLELLRGKLPESSEYLVTFIYIAYSMLALLTETVPKFKASWIECLGDLGRYRMAIEDHGHLGSRELWTGVARSWYTQASDDSPLTGRLYHHLAILSRNNIHQQLFLFAKSLCVKIPFLSARDSIMTLFRPLLDPNNLCYERTNPTYNAFVRVHGILFSGEAIDQLKSSMDQFLGALDSQIASENQGWVQAGYHVGISLSCLLLGFGDESSVLMQVLSGTSKGGVSESEGPCSGDANVNKDAEDDSVENTDEKAEDDSGENTDEKTEEDAEAVEGAEEDAEDDADADEYAEESDDEFVLSEFAFDAASCFVHKISGIVIRRWNDSSTLPWLHTILAFFFFASKRPAAMRLLESVLPWKLVALRLNCLIMTCKFPPRIDTTDFPGPEKRELPYPLPEDYAMRGLIYTEDYFPADWFKNDKIESDERYFERPSTRLKRCERILWIGRMLARHERWLLWNEEQRIFEVTERYEVDLELGT